MVNPGVVSGVSLVGSAARLLESPGGARRPGSARRPRECGWAWHEASPPPLVFLVKAGTSKHQVMMVRAWASKCEEGEGMHATGE